MTSQIDIAVARINLAIERHKPIAVFGLFSGGHDSFSASYVASLASRFDGIVHINTGIGIAATRQYVQETCEARGWKLLEYKATENTNAAGKPDPQCYEAIVLKHGFPGPAGHRAMYIRLKERALVRLARDFGAGCRKQEKKRIMLISGARQQESARRMGTTKEVMIDGRRIWVSPIIDWSKLDTSELLAHVNQPRNIVVDLIHKSGECLCGAFAKPGELEELAMWPQTLPEYNRIKALEAQVTPIHGWRWGHRPIRRNKFQMELPGMLCWSCKGGGQ